MLAALVREHGLEYLRASGPPPTVREYLESWLRRKSVELAPKTERNYRTGVENIARSIGGLRLDKLTRSVRTLLALGVSRILKRHLAREQITERYTEKAFLGAAVSLSKNTVRSASLAGARRSVVT